MAITYGFLITRASRDAMLAVVFATATCPSVCSSVCPSRAGIVSKRRKLASWFLYHLVAPRSYFSDAKFYPDVLRGSPRASASNKGGVGKISSFVTCESIICYSAYMLSPVRPSVCPSVRRVDHRKTVEVGIMKFSPYGSPIPLVSAG